MSRKIKSTIYRNDIVVNKEATRVASSEYFHVYVENDMGELIPALFTETELNKGVDRAKKNLEDILPHDCGCISFKFLMINELMMRL